ncbi:four-carbon acid sugar kinase family protein [Rhodopila globiformis]|nr:four-carbon acid sugar kinase family protein [Rhodopila globiformis]
MTEPAGMLPAGMLPAGMLPAGMLIVADDLSGAADCGVACAVAGLDTVVLLDAADDPVGAAVLAVDADTRRKPAAEAAAATARIVRAQAAPGQVLFKKLDSTLRGNVGAEIAATLAARRALHGDAAAIMAPAFPATGRTTSGGHQLLHGVRLEHTELWKAERIAGAAHIPTMLDAAGLRAMSIPLDTVRDASRLPAALSEAAIGHDVIVCDADAEADLQAIATASVSLGRHTVWAGSAGLARHLPAAAGLRSHRPVEPPPPCAGPLLFVVGSASRISREQVARLAAAPDVGLVTVPPAVLRTADWHAWRRAVEAALAAGHDTVVSLDSEGGVNLADGLPLCLALAALVAPCVHRAGALVLTGGETARAVLLALGATGLRLAGELEPGVPLSTAIGGRGLPVITKAGAFGHPGTLLRCRAALRSAPGAANRAETS